MTQEPLQCERIAAAVLQVFLCEGVPEQMDTCLLDTSGFIVVSHSKPQSVLCQHFPILIAEQVVLRLSLSDSHILCQNYDHLRTQRANLYSAVLCVPIHHLSGFQIYIPILDITNSSSTTPRVKQIIDNNPISVFTEIRSLLWSGKEDREFLVCICLFYCVLLLQVGDCNIRQSFALAPPQEGIEHPQIGCNGVMGQTRLPHGHHHLLQVSFGQLIKGHIYVYVFSNSPEMIMIVCYSCIRDATRCLRDDKRFVDRF